MGLDKNDRFLRTIRKQPVDATPVWIMRQAGRYLPEYRKVRQQAGNFLTLCKTPELATEVTLQPLRRFPLDAAIIFSDILTIPDAMGLGLNFVEGKGIVFDSPVQTAQSINKLSLPDLSQLQYVYDAIKLVSHELAGKLPLLGFCGSPWTLAAYMIQGGSGDKQFPLLFRMLETEPVMLQQLLTLLTEAVRAHLQAQIDAGCQAVMIFDTWGGLLNDQTYPQFSLSYIKQIISGLKQSVPDVPVILFTKGGKAWLEIMTDTKCDVLQVDWEITLQEARQRVGDRVALQGNLRPECLLQNSDEIKRAVQTTLSSYGKGPGHIFNLGHGITPDIPPEHVGVLVDAVHEYSKPFHR